MGCPAGIGPEIILRYFAETDNSAEIQAVVLGDSKILAKCSAELKIPARLQPWLPGSPLPENCIPILEISHRPGFLEDETHDRLKSELEQIAKIISGLINRKE